ncbi:hypothetical protein B0A75_11295 [Flavobacterium oncorhynchi]|uniref:Uncharacterized protein n=1 Tax=Flavobacterium oncorhynchi TaxID=728056 RepID=A0A226HZN1_9FLAO|nr:hypothetical protein [Flavobacterium oncorhynchi]OXA99388.1 hypothetical protein B0A75_11295 [Flavobacterium oncorhynchi]
MKKDVPIKLTVYLKPTALALMGAASPNLEKQGFLAVVFVYREYSGQQERAPSFARAKKQIE